MRHFDIEINGVSYEEQCTALSFTDEVNSIGRFDARLRGVYDIKGFQTVKIYDDDIQVFQGRVGTPVKENVPGGSGMPIGGLEWTGNLKDFLTNYNDETGQTLTEFLTDALINTVYGIGDIDELGETETEMKIWDTSIEFLAGIFSDTCIVYDTDVEITDLTANLECEFPDSNRRCCFYDQANGFFFIIAYDEETGNIMKYNSTDDFATWTGWTTFPAGGGNTPASTDGDGGEFGIAWDEANGTLYMIVQDGADIDSYEYTTTAAGALTYVDDDQTICEGNLICGPIVTGSEDVVVIVEDTTETDYELWQFDVDANTWGEQVDWATGNNDDPKHIFRDPTTGDDAIVIMFDDDNNTIEEWLFDYSGGTIAHVRDISSVTTVGYACGYQDESDNMYLVWEDTDLDYSERKASSSSWVTAVEVVDTTLYGTMNSFQLSGDYAGNLYLFYYNSSAGSIHILRRFEEAWDTTVEVDTDADTTSFPRSPADGYCVAVVWLDTNNDVNASLMSPYGITVAGGTYPTAESSHSYESGKDFNWESVSSGCTLTTSTDWAADGMASLKSTLPLTSSPKNAIGAYTSPSHSEIWVRSIVKVTQADSWGNNDELRMIRGANSGNGIFWGGWGSDGAGNIQWRLMARNVAAYSYDNAGTPVVGTEYCVEIHWTEGAAETVKLYVDGSEVCSVGPVDTRSFGDVEYVTVGCEAEDRAGATTVYHDIFAWGEDGDNRVGCSTSGYYRTSEYTASGAMNNWGTLDSTDDDDANTEWSVYDDTPAEIVGGLITGVDLETAGVASTDDPISIQADITQGTSPVYVFDVRLGEKQGLIDYLIDYEPVSTAISKVANILNYEYRLDWDNDLTMVEQLGEDKSSYIILKTAKSTTTYPDTIPNIIVVNREPDFDSFANAVKVLGNGEYPTRVEGTAQDEDSQAEYGIHWISLTNKDCVTTGMCNTFAKTELNKRKDPLERIEVQFYDDYDAGDIEVGDIVTIVDDETGLNQSARIMTLTYSWNSSGRFTTASLINRVKSATFLEYLAEIKDLARWLR